MSFKGNNDVSNVNYEDRDDSLYIRAAAAEDRKRTEQFQYRKDLWSIVEQLSTGRVINYVTIISIKKLINDITITFSGIVIKYITVIIKMIITF